MFKFRPILAVPAIPTDSGIKFMFDDSTFETSQNIDVIWSILSYCDGHNNCDDILEKQDDKHLAKDIIAYLYAIGAICDSCEQYKRFNRLANNPAPYYCGLSDDEVTKWLHSPHASVKTGEEYSVNVYDSVLLDMQATRHSVRSFSDKKLSLQLLGRLCDLGYNLDRHAVPSGGGLYPLKLYVVVPSDQADFPSGYYEYDCAKCKLIRYDDVDQLQCNYIFDSDGPIFGSQIQIIIAADIARQPHKYSNMGYRLTLIEVGHVAQNITYAAIELGMGSCELGGPLGEPLRCELQMPEGVYPMLSMAIGYESVDGHCNKKDLLGQAAEYVSSRAKIKVDGNAALDEASLRYGSASCELSQFSVGGGASTLSTVAKNKAVVESYERYVSTQSRVDFVGPADSVDGAWLDPRLIAPISKEQAKRRGLSVFTEELPIGWTCGYMLNGKSVMVPTDLVYYGHDHGEHPICYGNSSGIAAYTDYETALNKAVLELVERDAIMQNWFSRESPIVVSEGVLSLHLRRRASYWRTRGYNMYVLSLPSDYAIAVEVVLVGPGTPCFSAGASADVDFAEAAQKAYEEAECGLVYSLRKKHPAIDPTKVSSPADHGELYARQSYIGNIEWLWRGRTSSAVPTFHGDICNVVESVDPVIVNLSESGSPVKVIRALSPKLVPISFGYGNDYYLHPAIKRFDPDSQQLPHYFA